MILTCPSCSTSYQIADGALGASGRKVKCHKCAHVWMAKPANSGQGPAPARSAETALAQAASEPRPSAARANMVRPAPPPAAEAEIEDAEVFAAGGDDTDDEGAGEEEGISAVEAAKIADPEIEALRDVLAGTPLEPGAGQDVESVARRKTKRSRRREFRLPGRLGALVCERPVRMVATAAAMALLAAGVLHFRDAVVAVAPGTASLYAALGQPVNLRGLEFHNVGYETGVENGLPVLSVRGEVVNVTDKTIVIPEIGYSLRDGRMQELYFWTGKATRREIAPSGRVTFVTRLAAPPIGAEHVQIRFVREERRTAGRS